MNGGVAVARCERPPLVMPQIEAENLCGVLSGRSSTCGSPRLLAGCTMSEVEKSVGLRPNSSREAEREFHPIP
jgi:hypothetical protein